MTAGASTNFFPPLQSNRLSSSPFHFSVSISKRGAVTFPSFPSNLRYYENRPSSYPYVAKGRSSGTLAITCNSCHQPSSLLSQGSSAPSPLTRSGMTSLASSPGQENRPPLEETAWRRFPAPSLIPVNMLDKSFRRPRTLLLGIPLGSLGGPPPPWPLGARPLGSAFTGSCRGSGPSCAEGSWGRPDRPRTEATRRRAGAPVPVPASGASRPAPGRPPRPS